MQNQVVLSALKTVAQQLKHWHLMIFEAEFWKTGREDNLIHTHQTEYTRLSYKQWMPDKSTFQC